jgi:hypothetical protein
MYFDEANEKKAHKLEQKLDKRIIKLEKQVNKLEKKGKDIGDLKERISELKISKSDISSMRSNENVEFRYVNASDKTNPAGLNKPVTALTGTNTAGHNVITIFTANDIANRIHESRHGGDIARGEYSFDKNNNPTAGYGLHSEVSAYRAQYSYNGEFNYIDASIPVNQLLVFDTGLTPPTSNISNINLL